MEDYDIKEDLIVKKMKDELIVNGETYVHVDKYHLDQKKYRNSVIMLVLLTIAIAALIIVLIFMVKNKDLIAKDPIAYGMDKHGFVSCQCFDEEGTQWYSDGNRFVTQKQAGYPEINIGLGG